MVNWLDAEPGPERPGGDKVKEDVAFADSWDKTRKICLDMCPFCGGKPSLMHIGNERTKKRAVEIKCTQCRVQRRDSTLTHSFAWLEDVVSRYWNQRVI